MNFGQRLTAGRSVEFPYKLSVDRAQFAQTFEADFQAIATEQRQIDIDDGNPWIFTEIGPVSFDRALDVEKYRLDIIADWMAQEVIFARYANGGPFRVNTVDAVCVGAQVTIKGMCYVDASKTNIIAEFGGKL